MSLNKVIIFYSTLRDSGYCNACDFPAQVIKNYLHAMQAAAEDEIAGAH